MTNQRNTKSYVTRSLTKKIGVFHHVESELLIKFDDVLAKRNIDNKLNHQKDQQQLIDKLTNKKVSADKILKELKDQTPTPLKLTRKHVIEELLKMFVEDASLVIAPKYSKN